MQPAFSVLMSVYAKDRPAWGDSPVLLLVIKILTHHHWHCTPEVAQ